MNNQEYDRKTVEIIGTFATQEAAVEVNKRLQGSGFKSTQSSTQSLETVSETSRSQIKTQRNIGNGIIFGGVIGAFLGLAASMLRVQISGVPFFPRDPGLSMISVALAAGVIGAICFSLIGVITASNVPTHPLPNSPKVPSHRFTVNVKGSDSADLEKAKEIIQANGGQL